MKMKTKMLVSLALTFILVFNLSMTSLTVHQTNSVPDNCPFLRMGLIVFPGDDIPDEIPEGYSEPRFLGESSGGRLYCGINTFVIRGASINLICSHRGINMTDEDLDLLVDFVVDALVFRNTGVGFPGSFEDALKEVGLYETFFSRIGERINSLIS